MRLEVALVLKDDDGNTVDTRKSHVDNCENAPTIQTMSAINQWVSENYCGIVVGNLKGSGDSGS